MNIFIFCMKALYQELRVPDIVAQRVGKRMLASWSIFLDSSLQSTYFQPNKLKCANTGDPIIIYIYVEIGVTSYQYSASN
jgi:hypothetical protein